MVWFEYERRREEGSHGDGILRENQLIEEDKRQKEEVKMKMKTSLLHAITQPHF